MSSWVKSSGAGRRPSGNPNGSAQLLRVFRRAAPYPSREDRGEEGKDALDSYEELEQMQKLSGSGKYEGHKHQSNDANTPADRRKALYQKFYRQVQDGKRPPHCVILSVTNQCLDYPKSLYQCLQERGLTVEMFYLQVDSGLTRALQDVRACGSPLCILVEPRNVALSSCTVIIFSESLKIHRNMPKEQALDFVQKEHRHWPAKEPPLQDAAITAAQASQLLDDFLDREKIACHTVPADTRQLLQLLADGVHLYPGELETISEYVQSRKDYLQASNSDAEKLNKLPPGLGKPPPLLPTPPGPPPVPVPLLPLPGSHLKTKPPPLLSLHGLPGLSLGPQHPRGPMPLHMPFGGPGAPRGPLLHHPPMFHTIPRGQHGPRATPPSLKSSRPPLLSSPGVPLLRPNGPRH
ncbi:nuclear receptor coactivator 5 [Gouania willdenowi]|uniref:Nuclear receptor coactivator 5-like n=1 Tax=Gouania willdenowi TaxID=441366 RepID=A0A8C5HUH5_GOUWI|nr:nuclear receptor coactivator 5-like [Gouania willdenowi]